MTVNLFRDEWDGGRDRAGWEWKRLGVGQRLGSQLLGASLYELPPGQRTFPYHWHHAQEEWLIVLRGSPTLRDPDGERTLEPGDVVLFPRGPAGAHLVRNDTDEPVRLLMLSSKAAQEIAVYPDSGKVGLFAQPPAEGGEMLRLMFRPESAVDYFDGED